MTRPRKELISVSDTPYYHCVSRCVRRAFLCGKDPLSKRCYEHRRAWVEERIYALSAIFAIDIAAYAVMSNHYHLVIKLDPSQAEAWSDGEVVARWTSLFKGPLLIQHYQQGKPLSEAELDTVKAQISVFRSRLASLSWFMKCLNEPIAREANKEDHCTGHFFEGRYHSQALLSEEALLSCMAYVDLNPVRAGMAQTPEASDHTSIKQRIEPTIDLHKAIRQQLNVNQEDDDPIAAKPLLGFDGYLSETAQSGLPFLESDYLALVDHTGRVCRSDKRGAIAAVLPSIFQRLNLDEKLWLENALVFEKVYQQRFARKRRTRHSNTA